MTSAGNPLDSPTINASIARDAAQFVEMRYVFEERYNDFNQNYSMPAQMAALGISVAADQNAVTALYGAFIRLVRWMTAYSPLPDAQDMQYAARAVVWLTETGALITQVKADAKLLLWFHRWCAMRYGEWNQNANSPALLTACGISDATCQNQIIAVQGAMNNCLAVMSGGTLNAPTDMVYACRAVLGVS